MVRYMHPTNDGAGGQGKNGNPLEGRKLLEARPEIARMVESVRRIINKLATPQELLLVTAEWIPMARKMNAEEVALYGIECTAALFGKVNTAFENETRRNPNGLPNQLSGARDALWQELCRMREQEPPERESRKPIINAEEILGMIREARTPERLIEVVDKVLPLVTEPTREHYRILTPLMLAVQQALEREGKDELVTGELRERLELTAARIGNLFPPGHDF